MKSGGLVSPPNLYPPCLATCSLRLQGNSLGRLVARLGERDRQATLSIVEVFVRLDVLFIYLLAETALRQSVLVVLIIKYYHIRFCDFCFHVFLFSRVVNFMIWSAKLVRSNTSDYVKRIRKFLFLSFATRVSLLDPGSSGLITASEARGREKAPRSRVLVTLASLA